MYNINIPVLGAGRGPPGGPLHGLRLLRGQGHLERNRAVRALSLLS